MTRAIWPMLVLPFAVLPFGVQSGAAAETADFITGTYSSKEGCDALAKHEEGQGDYLFLTSKGVSGYQLNCAFVSVFPRPGQPGAVAVSFCDEPGYSHPELISLKPSGQDSIDVNLPDSPYSDEGTEASGGEPDQGGEAGAQSSPDASASDQSNTDQPTADQPGSDNSTSDTSPSDQAAPDSSSSGEGGGTPSTAEGMASGEGAAQSAGYVGLSGKYLRCQAPPG